ncbi:hypothetical protein SADUNF_Sadunf02G0205800 [Salix dunnii]|uniref:Glucose-methanol-choline oxidoreductase N-terminal domain-containing protein n=1 Tax=Salix dunnii TaxID=1413687 RepID=A0A835N920_9ROSI|nr:hypothetical protein SADUNF_Sadunf02G0205800 [Salix dunnii]
MKDPEHNTCKVKCEWPVDHMIPLYALDALCTRTGVAEHCAEEVQNQVLRRGCEKPGLKVEFVPRNCTEDHYCGSCCYGCGTGEKKGTESIWMVACGAVILTGCGAEKFMLENMKTGRKRKCLGVIARALNANVTGKLQNSG